MRGRVGRRDERERVAESFESVLEKVGLASCD